MPKIRTVTKFQQMPVADLVPYINNANKHSPEQIAKLRANFREIGFVNPIIIDDDHTILAGHARLEAARAEGFETVSCVFASDLTEAQKKAYIIADNRLTQDAEWDTDILRGELAALKEMDYDLANTGFDATELRPLTYSDEETPEDAFGAEDQTEHTVFSRYGDLYLLGEHRLVCGDILDPSVVSAAIGDTGAVNLILTDTPCQVSLSDENGNPVTDPSLIDEALYQFLLQALSICRQRLADDGSVYLLHEDAAGEVVRQAWKDAGLYLSGCIVWDKMTGPKAKGQYDPGHMPCLYGWKQGGTHQWYADRRRTTAWEFEQPEKSKTLGYIKPVGLMAYAIRNSSDTGDAVFDPFIGSGTTLISCQETGRRCIGIDANPWLIDIAVLRYAESAGFKDIRLIRGDRQMTVDDAMAEAEKAGESDA